MDEVSCYPEQNLIYCATLVEQKLVMCGLMKLSRYRCTGCVGTHCRTTPQQLTEVIRPHSTPWLSEYGVTDSQWIEHYVVNTEEQFGELVAIIVSVRHRGVTQQWYLQRVIVVSDPTGPHRTVRCFPCHDIVLARVTLRTGTGKTSGGINPLKGRDVNWLHLTIQI